MLLKQQSGVNHKSLRIGQADWAGKRRQTESIIVSNTHLLKLIAQKGTMD